MCSLFLFSSEAESERAHQGNELLWREVTLGESLDHEGASMGLSGVLNCVTLIFDVLPSHAEDHGWPSAVLNSGVASQLDQVSMTEQLSDVVALLLDFLHLLDGKVQFFGLGDCQLVLEGKRA